MSTPPKDKSETQNPKPDADENEQPQPLGPQGKLKVAQFRNRRGILAIVFLIVTTATIVFALWKLAPWFYKWDETGWLFMIVIALAATVVVLPFIWQIP